MNSVVDPSRKDPPILSLAVTVAQLDGDTDGSATGLLVKTLDRTPGIVVQVGSGSFPALAEDSLEFRQETNRILAETSADVLLFGRVEGAAETQLFFLYWVERESLPSIHPCGRFQPGEEFRLPFLRADQLGQMLGLLLDIKKIAQTPAASTERIRQDIADVRMMAVDPLCLWDQEAFSQLAYLLGYAMNISGRRVKDASLINEAIWGYQELSQRYTREEHSFLWAAVQNSMAYAYLACANLEGSKEYLEAALDAFRNVSWERKRDQRPVLWASSLNNYAFALTFLASQEEPEIGQSYLEEAMEYFQECFSVFTREEHPQEWAMTQLNLGIALLHLGSMTGSPDYMQSAIEAFQQSAELFSSTLYPGEAFAIELALAVGFLQAQQWEQAVQSFQNLDSLLFLAEEQPSAFDPPDALQPIFLAMDKYAMQMTPPEILERIQKVRNQLFKRA